MRRDGAGQRWELIEADSIQKHDLDQLRTGTAPLEQTFQRQGENPFTVRLTFLSSRPDLPVCWRIRSGLFTKMDLAK